MFYNRIYLFIKHVISITVLKYDDVIKKVAWPSLGCYFGIFWKILCSVNRELFHSPWTIYCQKSPGWWELKDLSLRIGVILVTSTGNRSTIFCWMSSPHFEMFQGSPCLYNFLQLGASPKTYSTANVHDLVLREKGALITTKPHVPPRLHKPILNVLPMYRYIFQGNIFPKQYYALNTIFKLAIYKHFKKLLVNQL